MSKDTDFDSERNVDNSLNQEESLTAEQRLERIENAVLSQSRFMQSSNNYGNEGDEIDLKELFTLIWQGKLKIIAISLLFAAISVFYALSLPNIYTSTLKLVPAQQESEGGLSSLAAKYGGLASMAGINIGGGGSGSNIQHAVELMNSWPYIESFVEKHQLKYIFMASDGWDSTTNKLSFDSEIFDYTRGVWKSENIGNELKSFEPSSFETYSKIVKEFISVNYDEELGIFQITVNHYSPTIAYEITNKLKDDINEYFRTQDKKQALDSIKFIENKIKSTANSQMREVFYNMIESHTQKIMMTEISDEYLLKTLIPAKVSDPKEKSKPKRSIIVIISFVLGGMLGTVLVLIPAFRSSK